MAETATSPAPAADKADKQANVRPAKPDENLFKQELAKAEKEHKASMDRLVRSRSIPLLLKMWLGSTQIPHLWPHELGLFESTSTNNYTLLGRCQG